MHLPTRRTYIERAAGEREEDEYPKKEMPKKRKKRIVRVVRNIFSEHLMLLLARSVAYAIRPYACIFYVCVNYYICS